MDRRILTQPFTIDRPLEWTCPRCEKAPLRLLKDTFQHKEPRDSRDHSDDAWEPDWIRYVYTCLLECSNDNCKEIVASSGTGSLYWSQGYDHEGNTENYYTDHFTPKAFVPSLKLFKLPSKCPESVSDPIRESFSLFFLSPPAASNQVRIAVEALLTHLRVKRHIVVKGKKAYVNLHQRILLLPPRFDAIRNLLLAVKWLGNAGSHNGTTRTTAEDVMNSYDLLDHVLHEVFEPKLSKLQKLAKKVNKKKGPA